MRRVIKGEVVELLERWRDGTIVVVKARTEELQVFLPTWRLAKGDRIEGEFVKSHRFWVPPKGLAPRIYPAQADSLERELGQAILNALPNLGYRRALELASKGMEAFDYLLLKRSLKELFYQAESRLLEEISDTLLARRWYFEALKALIEMRFTPLEASAALEFLGAPAVELAERDPFLLCVVPGISYTKLAARFERTSPTGALLDEVGVWLDNYGDTLVPLAELPIAKEDLETALAHPHLGQVLFLTEGYGTPRVVWDRELALLEAVPERSELPTLSPPSSVHLEPEQAEAFVLPTHRLAVLTGGPGTGKTFTLSQLVKAATSRGIHVTLIAPTGKAAQRMAQLSGHPATTVHKALGIAPNTPFAAPEPLPKGLVIMDESSMADLELLSRVLQALPPGSALLLVGDADQLPPVSPGAPFADLVGLAPTVRLKTVRRQAADSLIASAARAILRGKTLAELVPPDQSEVLLGAHHDPDALAKTVVEITAWYTANGRKPSEIQVLTPVHAGALGTRRLNEAVRNAVLGSSKQRRRALALGDGSTAYVGDKIIFDENKPQYGVMNGTMGEIRHISDEEFLLEGPEGSLALPRFAARWAQLGYATTVHRAQGSEWPVVILALPETPITRRRLVYTALTRAKRQVVALAPPQIVEKPIPEDRPRTTYLRYIREKGVVDAS